jgi:uncharacterized protein (DUF2236 family)
MAKRKKRIEHENGGRALSAADLDRLRLAFDADKVDPTSNLYGRDSLTWRINREAALLLGGGRALLLQLAHPLVAAGVAQHSNFRRDPLQRLWRTLELMLTITFADAAAALRAVRQIEKAHARVTGTLDADVGPFPKGTRYDANDPELLLWVHATLVDSALLVYERFVGRLTSRERAAYYEESKRGGRILGVPPALLPETLSDFEDYMFEMCRGDVLAVGPVGREVATAVLWPATPAGLRYALIVPNFITFDLLPPALRDRYGFHWSPGLGLAAQGLALISRVTLPLLPAFIREMPLARAARPQA